MSTSNGLLSVDNLKINQSSLIQSMESQAKSLNSEIILKTFTHAPV